MNSLPIEPPPNPEDAKRRLLPVLPLVGREQAGKNMAERSIGSKI